MKAAQVGRRSWVGWLEASADRWAAMGRGLAGCIRRGVILTCVAALFQGCHEPAGAKLKVRLGIRPLAHYAPLMIALDAGLFAEQGLDVEVVRTPGGAATLPALDQGTLDVAGSTLSSTYLSLVARGGRVRIVADRGRVGSSGEGCGFPILIRKDLLNDRPLTTARLRGLRASFDRVSVKGYFLDRTLGDFGLALGDLAQANMPESSEPDAFRNGALDLSTTSDPWSTRILDEGNAVVWRDMRDLLPGSQVLVLLYGRRLLDDEGFEMGRRFMMAYLRGVDRLREGQTERSLSVVARETGLPSELLARTCWMPMGADGRPDLPSVLEFQAWAVKRRLLTKALPVETLVDTRFLDAASAADAGR